MKSRLPIWYHLGATRKLRRLNNTHTSDCLRIAHGALIVADIAMMAKRVCYQEAKAPGNDYLPDNCECVECTKDRGNGCNHPWKCCEAAGKALAEVRPKWNPEAEAPHDSLTLTKRRNEMNADAMTDGGTLTFNPSITQRGDLSDAFRVF
ncbi:hypothetical protein FOMPIDRAFT_17746, partial [Fomitopsis schrenkii]